MHICLYVMHMYVVDLNQIFEKHTHTNTHILSHCLPIEMLLPFLIHFELVRDVSNLQHDFESYVCSFIFLTFSLSTQSPRICFCICNL